MRKRVKITESQIKRIIAESTRKVLKEEMLDDTFLGDLAFKIARLERNAPTVAMVVFDYAIDAATRCGITPSKFLKAIKDIADEEQINLCK